MESLIESLTCTLDMNGTNGGVGISAGAFLTGKHFLDNPKYLPCCRRKACNTCVLKHLSKRRHSAATQPEMLFNCPWCSKNTRVSVMSSPNGYQEVNLDSDEFARAEYERNLNEINHYLIKKLENGIRNIEDRLHNKEKYLNKRRDYIENEIHAQVEALKAHLDTLEAEMKDSLEQSTQNMVLMLDKFEKQNESRLEDMKITIENLKSNAMLMNGVTINGSIGGAENGGVLTTNKKQQLNPKLNLALQNQSVNSCVEHLSELTKISKSISEMINELKFDPHVDLPSASSLIGDLKCVHDINLKELFKTVKTHTQISRMCSLPGSNQLMPISPRYMCIGDPYTLFFTDSQTKQLVQVKLDSGELVRASNLGGQLKNPDGVCVNPIAGCIYVSDSELKIIFKIDYQFNILKKFGFRDLKWPRGIFYDYESSYPANGINPNRLYVCDPSSQFIAIYNDHEQLRDCLTISMSDEPLPSYAKANEMLDIKGNMTPSINVNGTSGGQATIEEELKFCPLNVFVNKTHIYVTDDWTGGNCIRIFDKLTHRLLRNVGDLNAWNPLGLVIDDSGNIFTVARLYYETGSTHLFCFNKDGDLVYKTNLSISNEYVTDIVLDKYTSRLNNRIVCSGDKKIHFFQF